MTSSIANTSTAIKRNFHALNNLVFDFPNMVIAIIAAIIARNPAASCAIPYTQSYEDKIVFTSLLYFFEILVFKCCYSFYIKRISNTATITYAIPLLNSKPVFVLFKLPVVIPYKNCAPVNGIK